MPGFGQAATCVDAKHHCVEDRVSDVWDGNGRGILLDVVAIKHGPEGVGGG